jgi:DUF4097 and DUF4098 domain-containing protein YvlB
MKITLALTAALIAFVAWAASPASRAGDGHTISSVNGSANASPGETYDSVSTVNGDVRIGSGATVNTAHTVNGEIEIEQNARVGEASTVNGGLRIAEDAAIERAASTVNGGIRLAKHARVGGDVSTVSGDIELEGAEVVGSLKTHNGDIELSEGAHVRGGIVVKKSHDLTFGWGNNTPPEVRICATCVVDGELRFERPVKLRVDPGAKVGKVSGETVPAR